MVSDGIIERIRKVLAYTGSPNENEAATAASKAQELLARHNLTMVDLAQESGEDLGVNEERFFITNGANQGKWRELLIIQVCRYHFTRVLTSTTRIREGKKETFQVFVIGEPTNVRATVDIYSWLARQITEAYPFAWRAYNGYEAKGKFRRGFFEGAVTGISTSFYARWKTLQDELAAQTTALVKHHEEAISRYLEEKHNVVGGKAHKSGSSSWAGYDMGLEAGREMDIENKVKIGE